MDFIFYLLASVWILNEFYLADKWWVWVIILATLTVRRIQAKNKMENK